jgi:CSLREA domain-containing protein
MSKFAKIFALFLFVFCFGLTASAATYTVTKTADTNDGTCDADCSLREAVAAANATPDNDVIAFSSLFSSAQTITLSGTEIVVAANGSLTINGPGASLLTISGNNASRILSTGANVVVNINNLRFTAGNGAGAVNTGRGGAIYNVGGTMVVTNSIFTGNTAANGGAFNNAASASPSVPGNLTIIQCAITNNSSTSSGAAMQNFSTSFLNIRNTTISGNTSTNTGVTGAIQANGTVTITNTTISGNSTTTGTGAGVYFNGISLTMTNSTVVNNSSGVGGGGLHRTGTNPTNIRNTIIANNTGAAANPDVFGAVNSQGTNIIGNVAGSTGWIGSDFQNVNPMLGALADNGGLGQTHLPLAGSPALDAGQNCVVDLSCSVANPPVAVTTDQRGVTRPQNAIVDIGSVEIAVTAPVTVSGKVFDSSGYTLKGAIVSLTDSANVTRYTKTNSFGNYSFNNVPFGASYTLNASSKGLIFNGIVFSTDASPTNIDLFAHNSNLTEFKQ